MSDLRPPELGAATGTSPAPGSDARAGSGRTSGRRALSPSLVIGGVLLGITVLLALASILWTPYALTDTGSGPRLAGPSAAFWLGTDRLGRDVFTQFMAAARSALLVAVSSVAIATVIGTVIGVVAAASIRVVDTVLAAVIDVLIAFPTLLLAMLVVTVRGASLSSAILAIGIAGSAVIARITRINTARVLREEYVTAAIVSGTGWGGIVRRHVIPNVAPTLVVQMMLLGGASILAEASLSYLGLGPPPPAPSWGRMLLEAQSTVSSQPWAAIAPGLAIAATVLGLNLLGDGLRETLDPQLRRAR
ncbi:ABC transporter permease [Brachybacterium hainanense]|uniref:ABC transporter permease n=1 Tax=Brachybacterium hainanense TaxID=1541174 RepID=A0ABV6RD67_9MICO